MEFRKQEVCIGNDSQDVRQVESQDKHRAISLKNQSRVE